MLHVRQPNIRCWGGIEKDVPSDSYMLQPTTNFYIFGPKFINFVPLKFLVIHNLFIHLLHVGLLEVSIQFSRNQFPIFQVLFILCSAARQDLEGDEDDGKDGNDG